MNFRALREDKLKRSQEDMAKMLDVGIGQIKKWDSGNVDDLSIALLQKIAANTGLSLDDICRYEKKKPQPVEVKNTWEKADFTKKSIVGYIKDALEKYNLSDKQKQDYIDGLKDGIEANLVKPSISIVGRSDTGKSTLINALIGMEKMPTAWTPTTSIAVYIKHIKDRPDFIKDDAWVFASHMDGEDLWNVKKLYDKEYCEKWRIAQGGVEILHNFGTRQGETGQRAKQTAGSAVVFLDAKILLDCDIVDLPGYGTERESDDSITFKAAQRTDILIYLSLANGFLKAEDMNYLKENIKNLPVWEQKGKNNVKPLSNLFIVASQAHTVGYGNGKQLSEILLKQYEYFYRTLGGDYWKKREGLSGYCNYGEDILPTRFFTYTTDIPNLCKQFNSQLKSILELLPDIIHERAKEFVREYVEKRKPTLQAEIAKYEGMIADRDKYVRVREGIEGNELNRIREKESKEREILGLIHRMSEESKNEFKKYSAGKLTVDSIVQLIKDRKIQNKKEDVECFAGWLQDELQNKCESILNSKSAQVSEATKDYVSQFEKGIRVIFDKFSLDLDFDAGFAFANALAKIGIIGGLGAYILGEAAWALGSLAFIAGAGGGIAIGAAALGPIGIVAGLAIAGALGIAKLFGGGWEKTVAKKILRAYDENKVIEKYCNGMEDYWRKTESAFNEAAEVLEQKWEEYVSELDHVIKKYDIKELKYNIAQLNNMMDFFDDIPLQESGF